MHKPVVTLNEIEVEICEMLAKRRFVSNRKNGVHDAKIGPQSNRETDVDGICAEFAFAKALNLYPDFSISPRKGGVELISRRRKRVDVKQTKYAHGKLLVTQNTQVADADIYVLVTGQMPVFQIAGWASAHQVIVPENLRDLGYGNTYCLPQSGLTPFSEGQFYSCIVDESREPLKK